MAIIIPYTTDDLARVRALKINGAGRVRYQGGPDAGREITYRTLAELREIESEIITALQAQTPRSKQFFATSTKGL